MRVRIRHVRVVSPRDRWPIDEVVIENGVICPPDLHTVADRTLNGEGGWLVPGFVDVHVHGGGGADLCDGTTGALAMLCRTHLLHGTTTILPTAMSASRDMLACVCHTYRTARAKRLCPNAVGLHLEGPFLSPAMCGAQRTDLLREPDEEDLAFLLDNKDIIRRVTAAPEVRGVPALVAAAAKAGIRFSMGHTNATYEQAEEACSEGNFTSVTHLYCATSGFHKVDGRVHVGVTQYAYADRDLFAELIGDGHHIPRQLLRLVMRLKGPDRVCLVTDAMRAAGTDVKESYLGPVDPRNRVIIEDGVAKLPDRSSFAGSIGTMDNAFRFAVCDAGVAIDDAVRLTSLTPAELLGMDDRKGSIAPGKDADLVLMDRHFNVRAVFLAGQRV